MRRGVIHGLATVSAALFLTGAGWRSSSPGWRREGRGERAPEPSVVIKMQRYSVPRPSRIRNPDHLMRDDRRISWPERDDRGTRIVQQSAIVPPQGHVTVVRDRAFVRGIVRRQRVEVVPNRFYWHIEGGIRYAHYFDRGAHWYGFYHGPAFYWTRFHAGRWWWFDARFARWVYWWDGFWWWPAPGGTAYVFVDNNYYPYEGGVVTVRKPELEPPPEGTPPAGEGSSWGSPDKRRMVQLHGPRAEAFLYDASGAQPAFLKYLGQGVDKVRFSGGEPGKPLQILLDFKDGSFALFSADGDPMDSAPPGLPGRPPSPPTDIPPASP